jgi:kinesin family protein 1
LILLQAVVNEDPNAKMIRQLREELEVLRSQVGGGGAVATGGAEASGILLATVYQRLHPFFISFLF